MNLAVLAFLTAMVLVIPAVLLVQLGIDWIADRIEDHWPDPTRAASVRFWFRLLAPMVLSIVLLILLIALIVNGIVNR
ncbi:hypothetical protein [Tautonia marina]|uniref:hypothetical protein n=1 Tax=Tautonia marina TaxID=2653855 RepID=UPI00126076CF|nr:hypothetical protein [Tautonia marina]